MVRLGELRKRLADEGWHVCRTSKVEWWTRRDAREPVLLIGDDGEIIAPLAFKSLARKTGW